MKTQTQHKLSLAEIARMFMKIGATAFGGWSTTAVMLEKELVTERGILKEKQLHGAVAYAQILPGGTQVCITSNVGYRLHGFRGAFVATVSFLVPGISMIALFAVVYFKVAQQNAHLTDHLGGLVAALSGLILANAIHIGSKHAKSAPLWSAIIIAFAAKVFLHINVLAIMLAFGIIGLAASWHKHRVAQTQEQSDGK